uniref:Uncharacterized protein n=1 Tax=Lepisosteus oculatus TaxID=7918 RepID=W5M3P1_LEPOC
MGRTHTVEACTNTGVCNLIKTVTSVPFSRSFVWSSLGCTAMAFVTGALAFWTPVFLSRAQVVQKVRQPCNQEPCDTTDSYIFGAVTIVTGIVGVFIGTSIARRLRDSIPHADPLICAVGMLGSSPCFFLAIVLAHRSIPATYVRTLLFLKSQFEVLDF